MNKKTRRLGRFAWGCVSASLVLILGLACNANSEVPEAQAESGQMEEGFVMTDDGFGLYYAKVGSGPKTVILPARLFAFDDFTWLADEGYTLISYDMRNRGKSESIADGSRLTIEADVSDLEAVRRHFGVERFSPIGYSYLGLMVVLYAVEHPQHVERIVQLGPVPMRFGTEYAEEFRAKREPDPEMIAEIRAMRADQGHLVRPYEYCLAEYSRYVRPRLVGDPSNVDVVPTPEFICSMPNEWPANLARHLRHQFVGSVQKLEPPVEQIRQLQIPVLTIHGRLDLNAPYGSGREWVRTLPNARLVTIDKGAHQSFSEYPEQVRRAVEVFLAGDWPKGAEIIE
ncbi:MAG TPA: alpha/beta hydrolase [Acidobacteriota bacterium]|nr:alpha/beta hydrolase [Acidobacteriota bacterium]